MKKLKKYGYSAIIRRTLTIATVFALALSMNASAFAAESKTSLVTVPTETMTAFYHMNNQNILSNNGVVTRGTSYPNQQWNSSDGAYNGSFTEVQRGGVFTNYYFTGYSKYYVSLSSLKTSSGTSTAQLYLCDLDQGSELLIGTSESLSASSDESLDGNPTGLFTDHKYCFKIRSTSGKKMSGNITVTTSTD